MLSPLRQGVTCASFLANKRHRIAAQTTNLPVRGIASAEILPGYAAHATKALGQQGNI